MDPILIDFQEAINQLGGDLAIARVSNAARPASRYLFNTILPERSDFEYTASAGSMTVRTTMAGLVSLDSPYPESGVIEASEFSEGVAKIANQVNLPEAALRRMQQMVMRLKLSNAPTNEFIQNQILNFNSKLLLQAHFDTAEWLRGQALCTGAIEWTFNGKTLSVDYGIPTANKLAKRTGNDAWDGSSSKFWDDVRKIRKALKQNVAAIFIHRNTIDAVRYNAANQMIVAAESTNSITFQRFIRDANGAIVNTGQLSNQSEDRVTFVIYDEEGEIFDPANPGKTLKLPFMQEKKMVGVARNSGTPQFRVGQGGTEPTEFELGYTHISPTTEGGGVPGRWSQVYTPEREPWALRGRAVSNLLPVIEDPEKICIAESEIGGS